ncbi:MAG: 3'-5' exonuclease [Bacteroides sp.]|nr:3'-5' exonuclease [Bacteroides sp.]
MTDFAAIDFETANQCRSSVCSVGVVIVHDGMIVDRFYSLIQPTPNYYTHWTTEIHGLTHNDTDNAPIFPEVWKQINPLIKGLPLVAHNSPFDEGCLRSVFKTYEMEYPEYPFYCTLKASRKLQSELPNHRLDTVAETCNFNLTNHHNAIADAEACAAIALKLL